MAFSLENLWVVRQCSRRCFNGVIHWLLSLTTLSSMTAGYGDLENLERFHWSLDILLLIWNIIQLLAHFWYPIWRAHRIFMAVTLSFMLPQSLWAFNTGAIGPFQRHQQRFVLHACRGVRNVTRVITPRFVSIPYSPCIVKGISACLGKMNEGRKFCCFSTPFKEGIGVYWHKKNHSMGCWLISEYRSQPGL